MKENERAKQTIYDYYFWHLNRKKEDINIFCISHYEVEIDNKHIWLYLVTDGEERNYCEVDFDPIRNIFNLKRYTENRM